MIRKVEVSHEEVGVSEKRMKMREDNKGDKEIKVVNRIKWRKKKLDLSKRETVKRLRKKDVSTKELQEKLVRQNCQMRKNWEKIMRRY